MTDQRPRNGINARILVEARREIGCFFDPTLFANPVYDILLSLLAADDDGVVCELSDGLRFANVPATTAIRYIRLLEERGLVSLKPDPDNQSQCGLMLTSECKTTLRTYIDQVSQKLRFE